MLEQVRSGYQERRLEVEAISSHGPMEYWYGEVEKGEPVFITYRGPGVLASREYVEVAGELRVKETVFYRPTQQKDYALISQFLRTLRDQRDGRVRMVAREIDQDPNVLEKANQAVHYYSGVVVGILFGRL